MARGRGEQRPPAAPAELVSMAREVGKTPEVGAVPPVQSFYVNDVQPTVETDGGITLVCAYQGAGGTGEAVAVTLPAGLFAELVSLSPQLLRASAQRYLSQGQKLAEYLRGAPNAAAEEQHRGGPPADLEQRRGS